MNQPPTAQPPEGQPPSASPSSGLGAASARQRRWPKRAAWIAAIVVALLAGVGIGSAGSNNADALNAAQQKLKTANQNLASAKQDLAAARTQVSTLQSETSAAKTQAQQATTTANAKAKAAYRARNAALDARSKSLGQRARAIKAAEGQLQSSRISADGVYVVGRDIKPGIYHTNGDGGLTDEECYFATLNSSSTSDIADNNNFDGPETVDAGGAYALQISGPCTWVRVG